MHAPSQPAPRHLGVPAVTGALRCCPEDFDVTEILGFEPSGDGPHTFVQVEKRATTTLDLVTEVARFAGCRTRDVGYSGLKDRDAVTRQWLSLPYRADIDWEGFADADRRVTHVTRNARKLRIGAHRGNEFVLVVRDLRGDSGGLPARLERIGSEGVPNYFGPQRFGRHGDNLRRARRWFVDGVTLARRQRRFALSAARALLFNRALAERVRRDDWQRLLPGEPVCLDGSRSYFDAGAEEPQALDARLAQLDVHPSGPLWGAGRSVATGECAAFESGVADSLDWVARGLTAAGLRQERRALRLAVRELRWDIVDDTLTLRFELTRGAFATSVVHELLNVDGLFIPC